MADGKKSRRNNNTFRRICREESKAGETVVVATHQTCTANFPCVVSIFVLAGLEQPCSVCSPSIQELRDLHGYRQEGRYWITDQITEPQKQLIADRITQADARNWENKTDE